MIAAPSMGRSEAARSAPEALRVVHENGPLAQCKADPVDGAACVSRR